MYLNSKTTTRKPLAFALALFTTNCMSAQIVIKDSDLCPNKNFVEVKNGHECVYLGLPSGLKWPTCNVGASALLISVNIMRGGDNPSLIIRRVTICTTTLS